MESVLLAVLGLVGSGKSTLLAILSGFVEPVFYLAAFGFGIGQLIGGLKDGAGQPVSYAMFMPNSWRRAAIVQVTAGLVPYALIWWAWFVYDEASKALLLDRNVTIVPVPLMAAAISSAVCPIRSRHRARGR